MPAPLIRVQLPSKTSPKATATAAQLRAAKFFTEPQFIPGDEDPTTTSVVCASAAGERAGHVLGGAVFIECDIGKARGEIGRRGRRFLRRGWHVRVVPERRRTHA